MAARNVSTQKSETGEHSTFVPNELWLSGFAAWVTIGWAPIEFFVTENGVAKFSNRRKTLLKFCRESNVPRRFLPGGATLVHIQTLIEKAPSLGEEGVDHVS